MATQTTHYNLTKPALTDPVDVTVLDENFDIIDSTLYANSDYSMLSNLPKINDHTLNGGENSLSSLGIGRASTADINKLF